MRLVSLKARILSGATLWTIGHFMITAVVFLNLRHESSQWTFQQRPAATAVVAGLLMYVGFLQVRRGLSPIDQLRNRLAAVHKGVDARVGGAYPAEVQPVVDELNALLDERERRVERAVAKAGDLAHGLKTPLAVLAHEAQQVRASGLEQLAAEIDQQIDRMRRQIDYHLARAIRGLLGVSGGTRVDCRVSRRNCPRAPTLALRARYPHRD
jgi:signal transduction histidine kinase